MQEEQTLRHPEDFWGAAEQENHQVFILKIQQMTMPKKQKNYSMDPLRVIGIKQIFA